MPRIRNQYIQEMRERFEVSVNRADKISSAGFDEKASLTAPQPPQVRCLDEKKCGQLNFVPNRGAVLKGRRRSVGLRGKSEQAEHPEEVGQPRTESSIEIGGSRGVAQ